MAYETGNSTIDRGMGLVMVSIIHKLIWYKPQEAGLGIPMEGLIVTLTFVILTFLICYIIYGCIKLARRIYGL